MILTHRLMSLVNGMVIPYGTLYTTAPLFATHYLWLASCSHHESRSRRQCLYISPIRTHTPNPPLYSLASAHTIQCWIASSKWKINVYVRPHTRIRIHCSVRAFVLCWCVRRLMIARFDCSVNMGEPLGGSLPRIYIMLSFLPSPFVKIIIKA